MDNCILSNELILKDLPEVTCYLLGCSVFLLGTLELLQGGHCTKVLVRIFAKFNRQLLDCILASKYTSLVWCILCQ